MTNGKMKITAVIPAGGSGRRMQSGEAKQYLLLQGIPLLVHSLRTFQESPVIGDIVLVVPAADVDRIQSEIVDAFAITKIRQVVAGGKERQDSVRNGLAVLTADCAIVIIHDAARPFVSTALIEKAANGAMQEGAVAVGVRVRDTVKQCEGEGRVIATLDREQIWMAQTPQAFRRATIVAAHQKAQEDNFYGTDDAVLVERMGTPVRMIEGIPDNIKITTAEDLAWAEHRLSTRK
ncbi:MAG TPA: 2-C-methyl-D-erythritol 4-phosphate cytidylyltransferase [Syntrophus sp. (in: bacteria)]|nr:2-C-methyl-D-erythritol 4-phosphate cytidylyltransferase [Syntrophus sp. (in: bacteria)]